jgi:hypothetical protein
MQSEQFLDYEEATLEERCGVRSRVSIPAMLDFGDRQCPILVTDLGIAGFSGEISEQLPVRTRCQLKLPSFMPRQSVVTWLESGVVGCSFERLLSHATFDSLLAHWRVVEGR